jgi:hypothetical protein
MEKKGRKYIKKEDKLEERGIMPFVSHLLGLFKPNLLNVDGRTLRLTFSETIAGFFFYVIDEACPRNGLWFKSTFVRLSLILARLMSSQLP